MREEAALNRATQAASSLSGGLANAACGRQSTKDMLLQHVERMRRDAAALELLAYQVQHVDGEAEAVLYRLLSAQAYR